MTSILGGVTTWSAVDTQQNPGTDRVKRECAAAQVNEDCPAYQEGLAHQRRTNILIASTGVVALTTVVVGLFLTNWGGGGDKSETKSVSVYPVLGFGSGVTAAAVGRF